MPRAQRLIALGVFLCLFLGGAAASRADGLEAPPTAVTGTGTSTLAKCSGGICGELRFRGSVNPNGSPTSCAFEYGTREGEYGFSVPCASSPGEGAGEVEVSARLGTSYGEQEQFTHFRLVASNAFGSTVGLDQPIARPTDSGVGRVYVVQGTNARVKHGEARIRLGCDGRINDVCSGDLRLTARLHASPGRAARTISAGHASYSFQVSEGEFTLSIRLRRALVRLLRRAPDRLTFFLSGPHMHRTRIDVAL